MSPSRGQRIRHLLILGRHAEASELTTRLLAERPDDPDLHGLLAQARLGLDDLTGALKAGSSVVALCPEDEWGHRICAVTLDRMGRHAEATTAAAEAVRLAPLQWQTHKVYAQTAVDARGMGKEARAAAERAVQLAPDEPESHFVLGVVAHHLSDWELARFAYERTLALDPQHAMAQHNLTVLDGGISLKRAARGYGNALRLAPHNSLMLSNVDWQAARFVWRIYGAALLGFLVGLATTLSAGEDGRVTPASVTVACILLVGTIAYGGSLARGIPVGIRRYVTNRLLRDPFLFAHAALTTVMFVLALVVCLVPDGQVIGLAALRPVGLLNVALVVWAAARRA